MQGTFKGRQTQFYIDVIYGVVFTIGFGYLLFVALDPRIAAFQGGLVLGYFLRVWENMSVYERILEAEVAAEAEEQVAEEVAERVPAEVEDQVAPEVEDQVSDEAQDAVAAEIEDQMSDEAEAQVEQVVEDHVSDEITEEVAEDVETEILDQVGEIDEELAAELRHRLEDHTGSSSGSAS